MPKPPTVTTALDPAEEEARFLDALRTTVHAFEAATEALHTLTKEKIEANASGRADDDACDA